MDFIKTFFLFIVTAVAEIVGCYLPYLWLKQNKSPWLAHAERRHRAGGTIVIAKPKLKQITSPGTQLELLQLQA